MYPFPIRPPPKRAAGRFTVARGHEVHDQQHAFARQFFIIFGAQFIFSTVLHLLIPTLPIYLKTLDCTEIEIGMLIGAFGFASILARPPAARMLMRVQEKTLMMGGALIYTVCSIAYLALPPLWPLLCVRILQGVGFGLFATAATTYVVNMTEARNRARILARFTVALNVAAAIGPPTGMVIVNRFGFAHLFLACAVVSFCALSIAGALGKNPKSAPSAPVSDDGFLLSKTALPPSIIGFMAIFIWGSLNTFYPLYARSLGVANPGLFFSVMAAMLIVTRTLGGRILDMPDRRMVIGSCIILTIAALVVLWLSRTQLMFLVAAFLWGTGHGFLFPTLLTLALERSESSSALVVATVYTFSDGGLFFGPLAMGVVAQFVSYSAVFLSLSILSVMGLLYLAYFTRKSA